MSMLEAFVRPSMAFWILFGLNTAPQEPIRPDGDGWEPIDFPQVTSLRLSFKNIIEASGA